MSQSRTETDTTLVMATPQELSHILLWTGVTFVVVTGVVGVGWSVLRNDFEWNIWRAAIMIGLTPVLVTGGLLAFVSVRKLWNLAESLTGLDLNGDSVIGEDEPETRVEKQLVFVRTPQTTFELPNGESLQTGDLRWLIEQLPGVGEKVPGWGHWQGQKLPSGVKLNDYDKHFQAFMELLVKINAITGRVNRGAGLMAMSTDEIMSNLKL